ncbi:MAG: pectinesterase family protein [Candidatus Azobacteroides sp.]|nr:pectinesterase family protein [Candidatus Azobacteroides sp.]
MGKRLSLFFFTACFAGNFFAQNPYDADIVVAQDGSGDFDKIQAAVQAVPDNSERRTVIYLKKGRYDTEKLMIPASKKNLTIIGESRDETVVSYHMYHCTDAGSENRCPADAYELWKNNAGLIRTSATLTVAADGFIAENLTIRNTAGPVGQALALTVTGDKGIYRNCNILGYQDTVYLWTAGKRSYFENCLVAGRTDYIYGAGIAFFQACEIRSWGKGWITAPSTPQDQPYGYVFNQCKITYATDSPRAGDDGARFALGRPWHEYPKVSWLYCEMSGTVDPLGWPTKWRMDYADTSTGLKLYEYKNTGPGADMSGRAKWAGIRAMTDEEAQEYTVQKVMGGTDGWDPTADL